MKAQPIFISEPYLAFVASLNIAEVLIALRAKILPTTSLDLTRPVLTPVRERERDASSLAVLTAVVMLSFCV